MSEAFGLRRVPGFGTAQALLVPLLAFGEAYPEGLGEAR